MVQESAPGRDTVSVDDPNDARLSRFLKPVGNLTFHGAQ
jgi:hypothetical protein